MYEHSLNWENEVRLALSEDGSTSVVLTIKTGFADWVLTGCLHNLNELNLSLQGFDKTMFKAYKIKAFPKKEFYLQKWIDSEQ